ncbi:hypothetical protein AB7714_28290 [Tardiphaga sp. 1201_B9_N1_1]|uniref:hypothetical protein n=1 Tax=unclassified Tardiphaga TaxID=2631404 RepID=UPI003F2193A5
MVATTLADGVRFNATSTGTGDFVDASAVSGYRRGASILLDGRTYRYRAENASLSEYERGYGVWNNSTSTLARTTIDYSSTGSKVAFSTIPQVSVTPGPDDLNIPHFGGRLTLLSGSPVMTTTQSAKTRIYWTPYLGDTSPIFDGTSMVPTPSGEIFTDTTDTTKNPSVIGASKLNDWFRWNDAGTIRLVHGPDWTSDILRSAGTALVMVNGVLLNNAAITNGPAAQRGTYVGTTVSASDSKLYWLYGSAAVGGAGGFLGVWNMYNRVPVSAMTADTTDTWSLAAPSIRGANNSAQMRVSFVSGLAEDSFYGSYQCTTNNAAGGGQSAIGVMYDSMTVFSGRVGASLQSSSNGTWSGEYRTPALGFHFFQAGEASQVTGNQLFYGDGSVPAYVQNGLVVEGRM